MDAFRRAVELNPAYADAQNNLAYLLMTSGKLDEAAEHYRKALESLGKNVAVDYYVCQVCGNTIEGEPEGPCEVCGAAKTSFRKVD